MEDSHKRRTFLKGVGTAGTIVAAGLAGCSGESDSTPTDGEQSSDGGSGSTVGSTDSGGDGDYTIGFQIGGLQNSWFTALARASEWYADELGVELNIGDGELDPTRQVTVARNLINSDIDALVVNPFDSEAMAGPVEDAADQGIPTFSVDSVASSSDLNLYTAFGNYEAGQRAAENAVAQLEAQNGAPEGRLVEVMIQQSAKLGVARHEGTVAGLEQYDDVEIAGEIITNNTRQDTTTKVTNFLQSDSDIDGFVCHAITTGNGTLNALDRQDMKVPKGEDGHKIVSQIDAGSTTLTAIDDGFVDVAIDQPVHFYGPITLHYIKEYLDAGKDESVLPGPGDSVESDAMSFESSAAQDATGKDIWAENVWAPGEVQETEDVDDVPWFRTNSVRVTEENFDADYLWGNWITDVA
ncbi:sugar ABC transporter substrate-binding protein [Halosimplex litoreum]|uniref:Sugar ABC transporter substrate-binding protein n=1 Tax=Halosimplex litoreum TaxID=1198301 RepID=A0A7T3FYB1_9EURY|nr:sugar ABC transporter substrate-binding protein [Halosimplex litoreum]QPV62827.1 sugar ABC transporter substrate-binding protein [Halosimplex litoreum]